MVVEDMASMIRPEDADKHILYFGNFVTSCQLLDNPSVNVLFTQWKNNSVISIGNTSAASHH